MKVVFLDIDGVLNTTKTMLFQGSVFISTKNVKDYLDREGIRFLKVLEELGVEIVLSSTWRLGTSLRFANRQLGFKVLDKTARITDPGYVRGDEIDEWLSRHPQVTHYVIIDDDSDMLPKQWPNFVCTQHAEGITFDDMERIGRILEVDIWSNTGRKAIKLREKKTGGFFTRLLDRLFWLRMQDHK